ncbi:mRNA cap guanine-N(7) methyltransferase-like [Apostichopus japonicus]|uniref:mRNA cap guanine-N(7) methyltransferase-like n=1 Tax=Stichopus japonicus TaxID=307972 RepID=UPI003AB6AE55
MADEETAQVDESPDQTDHSRGLKETEETSTKPAEADQAKEREVDRLANQVAAHYNTLPEAGREKRAESRIFFQRNFNNWIKSVCIADALRKLREKERGRKVVALDLCCGKGGDLLKWKKGNISHLVCADIAAVSVEQCEQRHHDLRRRSDNNRHPVFTAEFHTADCAEKILSEVYKNPDLMFDITSCQFSFHYSFESIQRADTMLRNACERLRPGGIFIGTMPNGCELVRRVQNSEDLAFGNDVYRVTFKDKEAFPLFGCIYDFHLEGVVDCPEFLVYFPLLEKMAKKYDMRLLYSETFAEFFAKHSNDRENKELLSRMKALEMFPPHDNSSSEAEGAYDHAVEYLEKKKSESSEDRRDHRTPRVGTLSKAEWEATSLYLVFAFVKEDTEDAAKDLEKETKEEEKEVEEEEVEEEEEEETASPTEGEVPDDDADSEGKRKAEIEESISATREIEEDEPPLKKQST